MATSEKMLPERQVNGSILLIVAAMRVYASRDPSFRPELELTNAFRLTELVAQSPLQITLEIRL